MQVVESMEILTSKQTQVTTTSELIMESDYEELEHYESSRWEVYEEEIRQLEESCSIIITGEMYKCIEKEGIRLNIDSQLVTLEFERGQSASVDTSKIKQIYQKIKADLQQETERLRLILSQKQSEVKILLHDVESKSLEIGKLRAENKFNEDKSKKDLLRLQNENKLIIEQVNSLKYDLSIAGKSILKNGLSASQVSSLSTQTDFEGTSPTTDPRRSGVQILKITSGQQNNRKVQAVRQTGTSPIRHLQNSTITVSTTSKVSQQKVEQQNPLEEQNRYLRDLIEKMNGQIEKMRTSKSVQSESRTKLNTSSDMIVWKNKIAQLESKNRLVENQKERLRGDISMKDLQLRNLETQLKTPPPRRVGTFKNQEDSFSGKIQMEIRHSKQIERITKNLLEAQNENRDLNRKLQEERREKNNLVQKYQLQINQISNELKIVNNQNSTIQKELTSAKSMASLENYSKEDSQRRVKQLQNQIQSLTSEKNITSSRYVSTTSYELLKQQNQKEKKALIESRDKYRQQITAATTNYNKLIQENVQTKNEKQRVEGELNRLQIEKNRVDSELQRLKIENQSASKKLRFQQTSIIQNSNSSRLLVETQQQKFLRESEQSNEQLRKLKQENQKLKQAVIEYKQILNNRNLTAMNDRLSSYEIELKNKNIYITNLENNLIDKEDRIEFLQDDNYKLKSRVTTPKSDMSNRNVWIDINGQLQYQQKMTGKLSEHVKQLKIENANLEYQLVDKDKIISVLNQRIAQLTNPRAYDVSNRLNMLDEIQSQYNEMLTISRERTNRFNNRYGGSQSNEVQELLAEIELYKTKYEKAVETANYLRQCVYQAKKTTEYCTLCIEYQELVGQLHRRINIYEVMMMSELRRMFVNCENKLNETKYSWIEVENIIYDLRSRTMNYHGSEYESQSEKYMYDSPISNHKNMFFEKSKSRRVVARTERRLEYLIKQLSDLVKYDNLNQETITVLLLRIVEVAIAERPPFVLPDYVYILYLDVANPSRMKVQLMEIKQLLGEDYKLYLSPEVINGEESSPKSLVWNLGIIFNLILTRKPYFKTQAEILDRSKTYRYENRSMLNFKYIVEGMLEREPSRRLTLERVNDLLKKEQPVE